MGLSQVTFERRIASLVAFAERKASAAARAKESRTRGFVVVREYVRRLPSKKKRNR